MQCIFHVKKNYIITSVENIINRFKKVFIKLSGSCYLEDMDLTNAKTLNNSDVKTTNKRSILKTIRILVRRLIKKL